MAMEKKSQYKSRGNMRSNKHPTKLQEGLKLRSGTHKIMGNDFLLVLCDFCVQNKTIGKRISRRGQENRNSYARRHTGDG